MFHQVSSSSGDLHPSVEAAYIGRTFPVGGKGAVLSEGPRGKLQRQRGWEDSLLSFFKQANESQDAMDRDAGSQT